MSVLFASWCWQAPFGQWAQAGAFSRRDGACGRIAGFWARIHWPGAHQEPTGSHRKHAWAPKQAPAWVGTCASTPAPLLHLPGPRTPCVALVTVSHAYGGSIRVLEAPVKRCRACASTRTCAHAPSAEQRTPRVPPLLPPLHTQRASAVNFGRTTEIFGRGEPPRATLQEERAGVDP